MFSIFMVLCVGGFSTLRLLQWLNFQEPDFIINSVLKDMHKEYDEPFWADENRFEFAVTFLSIRPFKFVEHDPRIGQIEMRRVEMNTTGSEVIFNKFPASVAPCDSTQNFLDDRTKDQFTKNITKFTCLN